MNLNEKNMRGRYSQVDYYPQEEFERRWAAARKVLEESPAEIMLIVDAAREGYDTWFANRKYADMVIVPKEGEIIVVLHREYDESHFEAEEITEDYGRYTKQRKPDIEHKGLRFINYPGPKGIAKLLHDFGEKKIGLVNRRLLTKALKEAVYEEIPGAEFIDIKQALDTVKTVKSSYELESLRYASVAHEQIIEALRFLMRPGKSLNQVNLEANRFLMGLGAYGDIHTMIIPLGKEGIQGPDGHGGPGKDLIIEKGDRFMTIYESNGIGGHHTAMGRHVFMGKANPEYKEALAYSAELNRFAASMMKPGNTLAQIRDAVTEKAAADGHRVGRMCYMHGLTTDGYFEQFAVNDYGEDWPLVKGAVLHCHPVYIREYPGVDGGTVVEDCMLLNTYLVTEEGGRSLVNFDKLPFDLIEIEC